MALKILNRQRRRPEDRATRKYLVDVAMDRYVEWREACLEVDAAYRNWSGAPATGSVLPSAAYMAALDREESAAAVYAASVDRLERL
jgi:hypothetical protein